MFAKDIVPADHPAVTDHVDAFTKQICEVIVGKNQAVKLAVACFLARGHLLIEDIPGVGKTTLIPGAGPLAGARISAHPIYE